MQSLILSVDGALFEHQAGNIYSVVERKDNSGKYDLIVYFPDRWRQYLALDISAELGECVIEHLGGELLKAAGLNVPQLIEIEEIIHGFDPDWTR